MTAKFNLLDKVRVTDGSHKGLEGFIIADREERERRVALPRRLARAGLLDSRGLAGDRQLGGYFFLAAKMPLSAFTVSTPTFG